MFGASLPHMELEKCIIHVLAQTAATVVLVHACRWYRQQRQSSVRETAPLGSLLALLIMQTSGQYMLLPLAAGYIPPYAYVHQVSLLSISAKV